MEGSSQLDNPMYIKVWFPPHELAIIARNGDCYRCRGILHMIEGKRRNVQA